MEILIFFALLEEFRLKIQYSLNPKALYVKGLKLESSINEITQVVPYFTSIPLVKS